MDPPGSRIMTRHGCGAGCGAGLGPPSGGCDPRRRGGPPAQQRHLVAPGDGGGLRQPGPLAGRGSPAAHRTPGSPHPARVALRDRRAPRGGNARLPGPSRGARCGRGRRAPAGRVRPPARGRRDGARVPGHSRLRRPGLVATHPAPAGPGQHPRHAGALASGPGGRRAPVAAAGGSLRRAAGGLGQPALALRDRAAPAGCGRTGDGAPQAPARVAGSRGGRGAGGGPAGSPWASAPRSPTRAESSST